MVRRGGGGEQTPFSVNQFCESKGTEFPIVVIPNTNIAQALLATLKIDTWHEELGYVMESSCLTISVTKTGCLNHYRRQSSLLSKLWTNIFFLMYHITQNTIWAEGGRDDKLNSLQKSAPPPSPVS